jgi:XRE family transcriptional regulator, regulator of sulfur utilization
VSAVGPKIRELREAASLTQEDLAHEAGISTSTLSRIERGTYQPRMHTLNQLAKALKVPVAELLG